MSSVCHCWLPHYNSMDSNKQPQTHNCIQCEKRALKMSAYLRKNTVFQFNFISIDSVVILQCLFCASYSDFEKVLLKVRKMETPYSDDQRWGSFVSFAVSYHGVLGPAQFLQRSIWASYLANVSVGSSEVGAQEMSLAAIAYKKWPWYCRYTRK